MEHDLQNRPRKAMEGFKLLPEGTLCEGINGQLFMSPSSFAKHQIIVTDLFNGYKLSLRKTNKKVFCSTF